ncbi:MAG: copper homeostasis protein CutC, partial [Saprospiraceae bacterium]|nr:copper homeostasis protein CutC [Saprospiraceae bacterium]
MKRPFTIEACVDSLEAAKAAEKNGADQIELCSRLDVGGLTPDFTLIKQVKESLNIPIRVMIRPREGDFYYSDDEVEDMIDSISKCRYINVEGVVLGATTSSMKKLDMELLEELAAVAYPLPVTIHK